MGTYGQIRRIYTINLALGIEYSQHTHKRTHIQIDRSNRRVLFQAYDARAQTYRRNPINVYQLIMRVCFPCTLLLHWLLMQMLLKLPARFRSSVRVVGHFS